MFPLAFVCYRCGHVLSRAQVRFDLFHGGQRLLPRCVEHLGCSPRPEPPPLARCRDVSADPGRMPASDHLVVENG